MAAMCSLWVNRHYLTVNERLDVVLRCSLWDPASLPLCRQGLICSSQPRQQLLAQPTSRPANIAAMTTSGWRSAAIANVHHGTHALKTLG